MRIVVLAGGVGGAKLADGLQQTLPPGDLVVIVNTGDDLELHGLLVMPDHDTVMYTLAGLADPVQGWGVVDDTFEGSAMLERYGVPTWFRLGDRDLATHVARTALVRRGQRLTDVCLALQRGLGATTDVLPMSDDAVHTQVRSDDGWLDFQDYFVRLRQAPEIHEVRFQGLAAAAPSPEVLAALGAADVVIVAPSNPIVSIEPILAVPGFMPALQAARQRGVPVVAVSPIVGGRALKGPADRMLRSLGGEASAAGVAARYVAFVDGLVLDRQDAALASRVADLGLRPLVTDTIMVDRPARARLATATLAFAAA
ncbi:MAG: 2-phospho-L-lactate transferase [Candidatus Limnocylindrales bacterium]